MIVKAAAMDGEPLFIPPLLPLFGPLIHIEMIMIVPNFIKKWIKNITEQIAERANISDVCENRSDYTCKVCGCSIDQMVKVPFAKCPKGKW